MLLLSSVNRNSESTHNDDDDDDDGDRGGEVGSLHRDISIPRKLPFQETVFRNTLNRFISSTSPSNLLYCRGQQGMQEGSQIVITRMICHTHQTIKEEWSYTGTDNIEASHKIWCHT